MPHAQTSSPSYLLLSSLDAARAAAQVPGTSQHHPHLRAHPSTSGACHLRSAGHNNARYSTSQRLNHEVLASLHPL